MKISVFLSYPKPCAASQQHFVERVCDYLGERGLEPRTLGVTDYDMDAPLKAIRRLMRESNGLITIAFRRILVKKGVKHAYAVDTQKVSTTPIEDGWLTTPWAHIEPAMAYQLGLPILLLREKGVIADGILEPGVVGLYMPEFDPDTSAKDYFSTGEWRGIIGKWEGRVRAVVNKRGSPPKLF